MFCFRCGLVAHNDDLCSNTPPQAPHSAEGYNNPRGALFLNHCEFQKGIILEKDYEFKNTLYFERTYIIE